MPKYKSGNSRSSKAVGGVNPMTDGNITKYETQLRLLEELADDLGKKQDLYEQLVNDKENSGNSYYKGRTQTALQDMLASQQAYSLNYNKFKTEVLHLANNRPKVEGKTSNYRNYYNALMDDVPIKLGGDQNKYFFEGNKPKSSQSTSTSTQPSLRPKEEIITVFPARGTGTLKTKITNEDAMTIKDRNGNEIIPINKDVEQKNPPAAVPAAVPDPAAESAARSAWSAAMSADWSAVAPAAVPAPAVAPAVAPAQSTSKSTTSTSTQPSLRPKEEIITVFPARGTGTLKTKITNEDAMTIKDRNGNEIIPINKDVEQKNPPAAVPGIYDELIEANKKAGIIGNVAEIIGIGMNADALRRDNNMQPQEDIKNVASNSIRLHAPDVYNPSVNNFNQSYLRILQQQREMGDMGGAGMVTNYINGLNQISNAQAGLETDAINRTTAMNEQNNMNTKQLNLNIDNANRAFKEDFLNRKFQTINADRNALYQGIKNLGAVNINTMSNDANYKMQNDMYKRQTELLKDGKFQEWIAMIMGTKVGE